MISPIGALSRAVQNLADYIGKSGEAGGFVIAIVLLSRCSLARMSPSPLKRLPSVIGDPNTPRRRVVGHRCLSPSVDPLLFNSQIVWQFQYQMARVLHGNKTNMTPSALCNRPGTTRNQVSTTFEIAMVMLSYDHPKSPPMNLRMPMTSH